MGVDLGVLGVSRVFNIIRSIDFVRNVRSSDVICRGLAAAADVKLMGMGVERGVLCVARVNAHRGSNSHNPDLPLLSCYGPVDLQRPIQTLESMVPSF